MRKRKTESTTENKITKKGREIRKQVKELAADLWQNEMIVKAGLAASGLQLAIAFSYASVWTWPGAVLKAAFIEACVWNINKAIQWGRLVRLNWRWQAFLWFVLIVVMYISIRANLYYEYEKKLAMQSPDGAPRRLATRRRCGHRGWRRRGGGGQRRLARVRARTQRAAGRHDVGRRRAGRRLGRHLRRAGGARLRERAGLRGVAGPHRPPGRGRGRVPVGGHAERRPAPVPAVPDPAAVAQYASDAGATPELVAALKAWLEARDAIAEAAA